MTRLIGLEISTRACLGLQSAAYYLEEHQVAPVVDADVWARADPAEGAL
jgi:hypothetical protein